MPEIAKFNGIRICMYLGDREHKYPHFHAFYGEYDGSFDLQTCELKAGELPKTVISKIRVAQGA